MHDHICQAERRFDNLSLQTLLMTGVLKFPDIQVFDQASVVKAAVSCLARLTAAVDAAEWPAAVRGYSLLLRLLLDERPKVRRKAQEGIAAVLAAHQASAAASPANEALLKGGLLLGL
jgi:hypothetical protein